MYSKKLLNGYLTSVIANYGRYGEDDIADLVLHIGCTSREAQAIHQFMYQWRRDRRMFPVQIDGIVANGEGKLNLDMVTNTALCVRAVDAIFNDPATIVFWSDGTKTVVKCQEGDIYSPEAGLAMCYMKKALGNSSTAFNNALKPAKDKEQELDEEISVEDLVEVMRMIRKEK